MKFLGSRPLVACRRRRTRALGPFRIVPRHNHRVERGPCLVSNQGCIDLTAQLAVCSTRSPFRASSQRPKRICDLKVLSRTGAPGRLSCEPGLSPTLLMPPSCFELAIAESNETTGTRIIHIAIVGGHIVDLPLERDATYDRDAYGLEIVQPMKYPRQR
jgi:hypothetical protein